MDMVKLVKGDRVIERRKVDYENNKNIWGLRGWKLDDGKPKAQPTPKPEPKPVVRTVDKGLGSMDNPNETTKTAFRMLRLFNDK